MSPEVWIEQTPQHRFEIVTWTDDLLLGGRIEDVLAVCDTFEEATARLAEILVSR
jgi:hypothetical protein